MANDDDRLVQTCAFVLRALVPYSSPYSSTDLAFDTDMLLHKKVAIDLETLKQSLTVKRKPELTMTRRVASKFHMKNWVIKLLSFSRTMNARHLPS